MATERISELLQEYDDLVDIVAQATHGLYQESLARWFLFIDEHPAFARECSRLELLSDFQSWYDDLLARKKKFGIGGPPLNLPANRDAAIGMQLTLFRKMAKGEIIAPMFAHAFSRLLGCQQGKA